MTPLFIVGVPRSGTTLARSLMQVFDQIYLPPDEFQLLPIVMSSDRTVAELGTLIQASNFAEHMRRRQIWPDSSFWDQFHAANTTSEAFQSLVLAIAAKDDARNLTYWGDKTPENLFHLDKIFAVWPDAKIIHVVRDPRSTVLSMKNSWGRSAIRGSMIWRKGIEAIRQQKDGPKAAQIYEIRYEDLTKDAVSEMANLSRWLDLPFAEDALFDFQTEERWSETKRSGIQPRGAQWDSPKHLNDTKIVEGICFDAMGTAGYTAKYATAAVVPSKIALKFAKIVDAWRVLRLYASERGWREATSYKLRQWRNPTLK